MFRAGAKTINNSTITGTWTTCVEFTTTESGRKSFSGCDAAGSVGTNSNHIYLSVGTEFFFQKCAFSGTFPGVTGCGQT
jgi:hypothetical protein